MTSVTAATDIGTANTLLTNVGLIQQTISNLTAQTSSGLISSDYAGLGNNAITALDLSQEIALNATQQNNATQAANVQSVTQTALGQIQSLVSTFSSDLLNSASTGSSGLPSLAAQARSALNQVASLLNTQVGTVYIFAGQDSSNPPVPDSSDMTSSGFYTAVQSAVATVTTAGAASVQAQLLAIAGPGATSPFSTTLEASNQPPTVDLGTGLSVQVGMLADQNTDAVSAGTGTSSTGSYMRDILMSLATIGSLGTADASNTQVQSLLSETETTLSNADDAINTDIAGLGARQTTITNAQSDLTATATSLTAQLSAVQDSDTASVATQLATAQSQLQASYQIIADLSQMTLSKYL
jgi:flagellar hook-associated protein 3 FlgL